MYKFIFRMAILFFMVVPLFNSFSESSSSIENSSEQNIDISTSENDISLTFDENESSKASEPSSVWAFVKMIIVLIIVVACIYAVFFFFKKTSNVGKPSDPFLRRVSHISLSPGKSVQVVTLLDNAYVIGVTDESINLIGQVNDKELVDAMNLYADKNNNISKPRTFSDVLDIFMPKNSRSQNVFGDDFNAADSLRRQRERFNSSEKGE